LFDEEAAKGLERMKAQQSRAGEAVVPVDRMKKSLQQDQKTMEAATAKLETSRGEAFDLSVFRKK